MDYSVRILWTVTISSIECYGDQVHIHHENMPI